MTTRCLVILSLGLLLCSCESREIGPTTTFSLAQLKADYRQLRSLIADNHPRTFTDWRELDAAFDLQNELLRDNLTVMEFRRIIAPAVSKVRCGHTRLSFPDSFYDALRATARHLPLDIRIMRDSLFVLEAYGDDAAVPLGSAVLSINSRPAREIIRTIRSSLHADGHNETFKDFQIDGSFRAHYLTYIESPEQFVIVFASPENAREDTVTVSPITPDSIRRHLNEDGPAGPESEAIEWSFADDGSYATLRVWFFDYYDDLDRFAELVDGFFEEVRDRGVRSLVLDLRGNDGGDPYSSAYLLTYLIGRPFRYFSARSTFIFDDLKDIQHPPDNAFTGELYVLVDGGCYSTTGHFCSLLKYHEVGTFIGVETGGSFACHGGYREEKLKHTQINLLLPHTTFITDVHDLPIGRGILPDYEIQPSIQDLLENRDPVFDKAVSLIDSLDT